MEASAFDLVRGYSANVSAETRAFFLEVHDRLNKSLSGKDLQQLIHTAFSLKRLKVEKKMEKRREGFAAIGQDLERLKRDVDEKLHWMGEYVVDIMEEAKGAAVETLNMFFEFDVNNTELPREAKQRVRDAKAAVMSTVRCHYADGVRLLSRILLHSKEENARIQEI
jgi:hypothetical protein